MENGSIYRLSESSVQQVEEYDFVSEQCSGSLENEKERSPHEGQIWAVLYSSAIKLCIKFISFSLLSLYWLCLYSFSLLLFSPKTLDAFVK